MITAQLTRKISSPSGDDDHIRVVVGEVGEKMLAAPLSRGAGVISSLVRADGITIVPSGVQGIEAGENIQVRLYRPKKEIAKTLFVIGSHDLTIDLLSQELAQRDRRVVSANVGSLAGLMAIRRGEAHFGGSHLLDPETGEYNLSYVRKYLPNMPVYIISWVKREQGFMVPKGNPKQVSGIRDLMRGDIRFVNRQRGAGTRVLLDFLLSQSQITPAQIRGYQDEVFTHLSVAADVASGRADCGLGVAAAAKALDLDFIHVDDEQYDLVVPRENYESDLFKPVRELMFDPNFKLSINKLDGYKADTIGEIKFKS
jgi:putative molybdopterin biosynthesis protein